MKKIAIIGAGISGLFLANLLEKDKTYSYKIFEKKSFLDIRDGYGIQLSVNSIKLLNEIGFNNINIKDIYLPKKVTYRKIQTEEKKEAVDLEKLVIIFHELMEQTKILKPHDIKKDYLSVREKMTLILNSINKENFVDFKTLLDLNEGKYGLIVSFLAI